MTPAAREMSIAASASEVRRARDWAAAIAAEAGLPEARCHDVRLAVSEAVANGVLHGSAHPDDRVRVLARVSGGRLVFDVADSGRFRTPSPPLGDDASSGRGLELVSQLMDEVRLVRGTRGSVLRLATRI